VVKKRGKKQGNAMVLDPITLEVLWNRLLSVSSRSR
jgi:hypothetical protein